MSGEALARAASLHDFEPLLPAEQAVLRALASGGIAKIGYQRPLSPTPDVRVRAAFLALLSRGGEGGAPRGGEGLQIMGGWVTGRLDLNAAHVRMSLWFYRCSFAAPPQLSSAHVAGSLRFADCALPGLRATACRVDGDLALNAGCEVQGTVDLAQARIGGDADCERLQLSGGEARFVAARIGGSLHAGGARLSAEIDAAGARGVALALDRAQVGGSVVLDAGFSAAGTVRLVGARIGGDLDCRGAAFDTVGDASWGACGSALRLDRARVAGALVLRGLQEPLQAASLLDARVGTLADDEAAWGREHVLDGFAYTRFAAGAPTDAPTRLGWLARQHVAHVDGEYRPDPWRRAIRALRRGGHGAAARSLAIGRERHLRRIGHVGRGLPRPLRWLARLGHGAWGVFAGYGHRPGRLLVTGIVVGLLVAGLYRAAA